ncbi:hypothetical protein [Occallatibacter riparius]|uniref:Uncharacterized protein n=1 Tax=Occallatibacter riparius TaxID=1002689 RepID=A0A9J7BN62_9BACT|nr:hypothetical protein [Occallatibacter riparius]UWZ84139.1 hypothetical protein MOP44_26735 [Occallatibacter riparius]
MRNPLEHTKPSPEEKRTDALLWTAFLLNPLAMGINTIVGFTVAHWTSDTGRKHYSYLVSAIDFLLCICALGISISLRSRFSESPEDVPIDGRRVFMAKLSILISAITALLVIAQTLALLTLHPFD